MTEISIYPFVRGILIDLTWAKGVLTSPDSSVNGLYEFSIPKNI